MERRGWDGSPPADDTEARKKIIDARWRCIERRGTPRTRPCPTSPLTSASHVEPSTATSPRTEELFAAVAEVALDSWIPRIEAITSGALDVTDLLVELVAHIIEELPNEPLLTLLLASDHMTTVQPPDAAARRDRALPKDPAPHAHRLGRFGLRRRSHRRTRRIPTPQHPIHDHRPAEPPRTGTQLRAYLRRWIAPALKPNT